MIHGEHLDLSVQAYIASSLEQNFIYYTDQVMRNVLGYSDQEIARLKEERVLY